MKPEEELRFLAKLEKDLPAMAAKLEHEKSKLRGLSGNALLKGQRALITLTLEVDGMRDTINTLRKRHGK
ncbi:hypothetical protein HUN41_00120 [Streptomyces phage Coruscant]|uniref:Uncharacterized protein n=1 Tax=Streptomyces phage Coruscant TaxID=2739834 RepID=A0A7G4AW50_9CAUD|nr:hypothetical protein PP454_gp177 [Streptomyces phage Coruscant]QMP84240.1 hypothetical protein HUN41_00120 [Streptomyces phage Coruscant]